MSSLANLNPAISAPLPQTTAASTDETSNAFGDLSSTDFVRILVEELSNQDPFEPNDSAAILEQLSSLRSIESDISLQGQLENLVLQNSIGQAGSLIGREVQGLSLENDVVSGIVTSVRVVDGATEVQLDSGVGLPLDRVTEISNVEPAPAPAAVAAVAAAPIQQAVAAVAGLTTADSDALDPAEPAIPVAVDAVSGDAVDQLLDV